MLEQLQSLFARSKTSPSLTFAASLSCSMTPCTKTNTFWVLLLLLLLSTACEATHRSDNPQNKTVYPDRPRANDISQTLPPGTPPPLPDWLNINCSTTPNSPSVDELTKGILYLQKYRNMMTPNNDKPSCDNQKSPGCTKVYGTGKGAPNNGATLYICGGPLVASTFYAPSCTDLANSFQSLNNSCQQLDNTTNPPVLRAGGQVWVKQVDDPNGLGGTESYYGTVAQDFGQN